MTEDRTVQLNYVIPIDLEDLLTRYCKQNLVSPSALVRRLILEYIEGCRYISLSEHPVGRRTTAALSTRLLDEFSRQIESRGHATKASVIASLLNDFLPNRVYSGDTVKVTIDLPVEVFNKVYDRYGPGPVDVIFAAAMANAANVDNRIKEANNA